LLKYDHTIFCFLSTDLFGSYHIPRSLTKSEFTLFIQHLNEDRKKLFADIYLPSQDHFVYQDTTSNYEKLEDLLPTFFKSTELKSIWRAVSSNEAEYEKTKGLLESQKGDTILIVRNFDGLKEAIHEETKFSDSKDSSINLFWTKNKEQRKKLTQFREKTKQEAFEQLLIGFQQRE
jgi:hypothetical protein